MTKKPEFLYHYSKADTAIEKILPFFELKMNRLAQMNDPEENLSHEVEPYNYVDDLDNNNSILGRFQIAQLIRNQTIITSFSLDSEVKSINSKQTKGYHLNRMWAQYGGLNTGVCFVINYEKFKEENLKCILTNGIIDDYVTYDDLLYRYFPTQLFGRSEQSCKTESNTAKDFWKSLKSDNKFINERFFKKNNDWRGEQEYRFLAFNDSSDEVILSIEKSIEKIVLGPHFSRYKLPSLLAQVDKDKIIALGLDNGGYKIKKTDFDKYNLKL